MQGKTYFPIKTSTACQSKWTWSSIRLYHGNTSSCHRVQADPIGVHDFDDFHNTPKKLQDRQLMLEGQWPTGGCEYCQKVEQAGGASDRILHLKIPDLTPPELDTDPTAIRVSPRIVEIYFDNVCNMACVYCGDGLSSRIQQENNKFGRFEKQGVIIDNRTQKNASFADLTERFWQWMTENHHNLQRLHVMGGEPFFQHQFDRCMDFFDQNPSPQLELNIISNLMLDDHRFKAKIDRIKQLLACRKIKRFDLTASIDCFGIEQEYVRYGLNLDQWCRNFEYAVDQKWIRLNINQTLCVLTLKTMPALLQFINKHRASREIGHFFGTVVQTHDFLHPGIFGPDFFDFEPILAEMPQDTLQHLSAREQMLGIMQQINSCQRDQDKINQLGIFLDEIDRRRLLDWRTIFPWLEKEIEYVV